MTDETPQDEAAPPARKGRSKAGGQRRTFWDRWIAGGSGSTEGLFLLALIVFYFDFAVESHVPIRPAFRLLFVVVLAAWIAYKALSRSRQSVLLAPAVYLVAVFAPFSLLGLAGLYPRAWLMALVAVVFALVARSILGSTVRALIGGVLILLAMGAVASRITTDPEWGGDCAELPDVVMRYGGVLKDEAGAQAVQCDAGGHSVYVSYPDKEAVLNVLPYQQGVEFPLSTTGRVQTLNLTHPEGNLVVPLLDSGQVRVLDARTGEVKGAGELSNEQCRTPIAVGYSAYSHAVALLCRDSRSLHFASTIGQPNPIVRDYVVRYPSGLALNPVYHRAYITDLFGTRLREMDLSKFDFSRELSVGLSAAGAAVSSDGKELYIGRPLQGRVDVYDAVEFTKLRELPADFGVSKLHLSSDGKYLFAAGAMTGKVTVFDFERNVRMGPYQVGRPIRDMSYCHGSRRLYVTTPCSVRFLDMRLLIEGTPAADS
ncbi:MAG: hypothetical protein H6684_14320 [Deltaproteobacteria bacterium]|nr:hypothetical protein [bacterium]MCB9476257.1 hypothetical protein [Deltaproteobacteria bacterium]MCB9489904.1 hypothetical protein [Deltaproteobacteria bacterium]